jgi:hypothetical protein
MKRLELIFALSSIISIGLNLFFISGGTFLVVCTLGTLSVFYFHFGFAIFNNIRLKGLFWKESYKEIRGLRIAGGIVAGAAISLATIGILFKIQNYPGAQIELIESAFFLLVVLVVSSIRVGVSKNKNKSKYCTGVFIRAGTFFYFRYDFNIYSQNDFYQNKIQKSS